jgi:hypothetical protein
MKTLILVSAVAALALLLFAASAFISSQKNEIEDQNNRYHTEEAEKDALDIWIDRLAEFECKNCPDNFRHLDKNNRYSYSCLQFQEDTFRAEIRRYKLLPFAEDEELMNFIYDCPLQKSLARYMILAEGSRAARSHWLTSVIIRGLGDPPVPEN